MVKFSSVISILQLSPDYYNQIEHRVLSKSSDLFNVFIIAHEFGRDNSLALVTKTLKQAKQKGH